MHVRPVEKTIIKAQTTLFVSGIGEENLGKDYFEGDMMLTPQQQAFLDNIKTNGNTEVGTKRALIKDQMYLWPKAQVYFDFHKGVGKSIINWIYKSVQIP